MNYFTERIKNGTFYYRVAHSLACQYAPESISILDVGGGLHHGCRYLDWYRQDVKVVVDIQTPEKPINGVQFHKEDFMKFSPGHYGLVLCLQVIEHIQDAEAFAQKLLRTGETVIVSVPYKWEEGVQEGHIHDPVDEIKMRSWFGKEPIDSIQCDHRLINVYKGNV